MNDIRKEIDSLYDVRKTALEQIENIRENICKHEETYEGNYSWRIGNIQPAIFCKNCDKLIKIIEPEET